MPHSSERRRLPFILAGVVVAILAWGALAFGAVYPWAYTPLALAAAAIGIAGLVGSRAGRPPVRHLALALCAIAAAIAVQLVPLPAAALARISPHATEFLRDYTRSFGVLGQTESAARAITTAAHPLSIGTTQTIVGLLLFASMALLLLGTSRVLSVTGALTIASPLIAFGILLALVGIGQSALTQHEPHPLIYGFWRPQFEARPFGPFVNPNHFAGWMLMVLPLGLALFYGLNEAIEEAASRRRNRISLVSSPQFGAAMIFGISSLAMGVSLVMTRSRSGIAALAAGSLMALWIMIRQQRSIAARAAVVASFVLLLGGALVWAGFDAVLDKALSTEANSDSLDRRIGAWKDTLQIIRDFPLTGSGFNTYGTAMTVYQTGSRLGHFAEAHNDYLQIAAEGGLLVGIPVLLALVIFVRDVRRRFREAPKNGTTYWLRVGAVIGLVSIAGQSLVEFSLQMPGNAALFAVVAAIALHRSPRLRFDPGTGPAGLRVPSAELGHR